MSPPDAEMVMNALREHTLPQKKNWQLARARLWRNEGTQVTVSLFHSDYTHSRPDHPILDLPFDSDDEHLLEELNKVRFFGNHIRLILCSHFGF
jgi:hypothetical protein